MGSAALLSPLLPYFSPAVPSILGGFIAMHTIGTSFYSVMANTQKFSPWKSVVTGILFGLATLPIFSSGFNLSTIGYFSKGILYSSVGVYSYWSWL